MDKIFMTTNAQMRLLRSRGLRISGSYAKQILEKENYYNLINGYKSLFLDPNFQGQGEKYKAGADIKELYALFLFDRELRSLFLRYILEIENHVRSVIAHDFSKKYGHDNYLKIENFDNNRANLSDIADLISIFQREVANQIRKKNPMIMHYVVTYGYIPPWVIVNITTFGTLSKFYSLLKQKDQNDIGRHFNIMPHDMKVYLKNLALARNWCAHDERFFDQRTKSQITSTAIHHNLGIPSVRTGQHQMGKDDIFSLVIIVKRLVSKRTFNKFFYSLKALVEQMSASIYTISIAEVYSKLGFPGNWKEIRDL
jgi:abortive infection bacteriophage resistance protein